jgi:nucleoside-diphosphate-sugar epimerase
LCGTTARLDLASSAFSPFFNIALALSLAFRSDVQPLDYAPTVDLREGLRRTIAWYRAR